VDNKQKKVALLVHGCDRYEFLFKGFHYFFSKNWDYNVPCTYYFATEEKDIFFPEFINIKSGKGEWTNRLAFLFREKIKEDYILYIQEDMWLNKKVNPDFFKQLFALTFEHDWKQVKLHSSSVYKTSATPYYIEGFNIAVLDNSRSKFLMSHQVTLWEKEFFLDQLAENENVWQNEAHSTERLRKVDPVIMHIDYFAENGGREINKNRHPAGRSEYQAVSVSACLYKNIIPYISELMKGNKEERKYAKQLRYHYIFQLTHDGKTRPRKEDSYTGFKIWLKDLPPRLKYAFLGK